MLPDEYYLKVDGFEAITGTPVPIDPLTQWYWIPPDQVLDAGYQDTEYKTRKCTLTADENSCPGVVILGEADDHKNSRTYKLNKKMQYFAADLMSLSMFGKHFTEFASGSDERAAINHAFTWTYKNDIVFCNGDSGFGALTPKINCLTGQYGAEFPTVDAYRWLTTCSVRPDSNLDNPIVQNKHGEWVMAVDGFLGDTDIPLSIQEDTTFETFLLQFYPILESVTDPACMQSVLDELFAYSCNKDVITFDYDVEILEDPRVGFVCQQELHGNVENFAFFTNIDPTPFPFIRRVDQPAYYPLAYLVAYSGERRPIYYNV